MSDTVCAENIAREVDEAARQLAWAGRLDLTRAFIQHGDVTVYAHVISVAPAQMSAFFFSHNKIVTRSLINVFSSSLCA